MTQPLRVFVVEDEAVVLMQMQMMLEDAGHIVVGTAMSPKEALPLIDDTCPELLLIDLQLKGGTSGVDLVHAVLGYADLTIVFVTANVKALSDDMHGAAAVIAKPFNETTLDMSIAFLEECVHRPPPSLDLPFGLRLAPAYSARLEGMRRASF